MGKDVNRKEIHMVLELIKRYSLLLIVREMEIKATMRYHFLPIRLAKNEEVDHNPCC